MLPDLCWYIYFALQLQLWMISSATTFESACDSNNYGPHLSSRAVVLPKPMPEGKGPRDSEILHWYVKGLGECNAFLKTIEKFNDTNGDQIRENSFFYKLSGLLLWPFGPLQECPTHSQCWFGILSCGTFREKHFMKFYESRRAHWKLKKNSKPPPPLPPTRPVFDKWSMRAIHVHTHISGVEGVLPDMYHREVDLSTVQEQVRALVYPTSSIQIGLYTLTLPGHFTVDMWLQGFYMGKLFAFSEIELSEGLDEVLNVPFHASDAACGGPTCKCLHAHFDCCDCYSETFLVGAPFEGRSVYRGHMCATIGGGGGGEGGRRLSRSRKGEKAGDRVGVTFTPVPASVPVGVPAVTDMYLHSLAQQAPLPQCTDGNHIGRWLSIPESVLQRCRAAVPSLSPSLSPHQLEMEVFLASQTIDTAAVWAPILEGMTDTSLDINTRLHYAELNRYILPTDNICSLQGGLQWSPAQPPSSSSSSSKTPPGREASWESVIDIYAPYSCRYAVMSTNQAHSCLKTQGITSLVMHGDSLMRMLFGDVAKLLQLSDKSQAELKTLAKSKAMRNEKNLIFTGAGLTLVMMTRYEPYREPVKIPVGRVDALVTNYAIAHNLLNSYNPRIFSSKVNASGMVSYVQAHAKQSVVPPIKRLAYLAANDLQSQYCYINQPGASPNNVRIMNHIIRQRLVGRSGLNFGELDQFLLTAPKTTNYDGFHYYGPARQMVGHIFLNMMCSGS